MPRPVPLFCWYFIIASPLAFAQSIDLAAPIAPVSALESLRISAAGELGKQEDQCYETQSHNSPALSVRGGYFQGGKCRVRDDSCEQIWEKGVAFLPLNSLVGRAMRFAMRRQCSPVPLGLLRPNATGHAAAPASPATNLRRFMCGWPPPGKR